MDCLTESLGGRYKTAELVQLPKDRLKWRFMNANVTWKEKKEYEFEITKLITLCYVPVWTITNFSLAGKNDTQSE